VSDFLIRALTSSDALTLKPMWDALVSHSDGGSVFASWQWINHIAEAFSLNPMLLTVSESGRVVAGLPLFTSQQFGLRIAHQPPLTPYTGVIFFPQGSPKEQKLSADEHRILGALLPAVEQKYHRVFFTLSPKITDVRPFVWRGWLVAPRYTYVLRLEEIEQVWVELSSSLRRKIRGEAYYVEERSSASSLISLLRRSYERTRLSPPVPVPLIERLCTELLRDDLLMIFAAVAEDGTTLAERAIIRWSEGKRAYDWLAGANYERNIGNANHILVWHIIQKLAEDGINEFDFLGANTPTIAEFKRQFGGDLRIYFEAKWYRWKWIRMVERVNELIIQGKRKL